ncbi:MAG: hypothetical protein OXE79_08540 [Acidimicrobiaceae bacterium]|nr:hypothetical protein [Acidimicrobiaceae bacterium]MCY4175658.1 hypothetical protein [Acidimicrobiaceae bacterium]
MTHRTAEELDAALGHIREAPSDCGEVKLIVCRPRSEERRILSEGRFDREEGLVGDDWRARGSSSHADGRANPLAQVTVMNSRVLEAIAGEPGDWPPAGDQLYMDFDVSAENLPEGTRLSVGQALLEVTAKPHTGCAKFTRRFGLEAMRWVNSEDGMKLRLRGINTRVVQSGTVRVGDLVTKSAPDRGDAGRNS